MDDIANAVGITKAGVYFFISGGKQDLLYSIISYGMDRVEQAVIEPARSIADAEARLRAIITNHTQLITSRSVAEGFSPVTVAVDEMGSLSPAQRRKIIARKRAYVDLIRDTLQQLKDESRLKDLDVTVAAFNILGMIMWLARWYRPDGKLTGEQVAEETCKMAMGGILQSPSRSLRK
jgi:AcrR family transcriptional regulator